MFSDIPKLHTIDCARCSIGTFPKKLEGMNDLRIIKLPNNLIKTLDPKLGDAPCLEELVLDSNKIRLIDEGTFARNRYRELKYLNLCRNNLKGLPNDFCLGLEKLETLELRSNSLVGLPGTLFSMDIGNSLQILDLDHNEKLRRGSWSGRSYR